MEINKGNGSKPAIFFMHCEGGNVLEYWPLSKYFPADQAIYALQAKGLEGETVVSQSVEEMAESFLSEVQRVQPKGPFYLGGYCLGGLVAYEMARQLITRGEKVNFLALISARTPDYLRKSNSNASMVERLSGRISERVRLERDNLFHLNWNQKYNYLRERVMRLSNLIQVNGEIILDQIFSRLRMPVDWHSRDYILYRSLQNQDHAFAAYKPKPSPASVVMFRVKNTPGFFIKDDFLGWSELVRGGIRAFEVNCFHKNIMKEPNVRMVGQTLSELLLSAQSYVMEVQPAAYAALAANEAEKRAELNILEVMAFGSFGRVYLGGEERDIMAGYQAAVDAVESVAGRVMEVKRSE